jgi:hypothetical protein
MKTSNRILLGVFIATLMLTATVNLIVYAKYKRGDYVPFERDAQKKVSVALPATKYVSVTALCSVELINGASPRFEVHQGQGKGISYKQVGDTLFINGNGSLTRQQMEHGECNHELFKLYLPAATQVYGNFAGIRINGNTDSTEAPSFNIHLGRNSYLSTGSEMEYTYLNQLQLQGDTASFELEDRIMVNELNLKMSSGKFNGKDAAIRNVTLDTDNSSSISLSGFSIKNIK